MIAAEQLVLELARRKVLDRVSIHVDEGECVALVGPNGSGKTSILRSLLGLVPFQGRASIGGHDVVTDAVAARALVGYVPQRPAFGDVTVREAIAFTARLRRVDPARVRRALAEVGLEREEKSRVRTLSGGMQQRLALAVALMTDAPVLLLDEPTASLDRQGRQSFLDTLGAMRRKGQTLLYASHHADEVSRLADRVVRLENGRVLPALRQGPAGPDLLRTNGGLDAVA